MESRQVAVLAALIILAAGLLKWYTDIGAGQSTALTLAGPDTPSTLLQQVEQTRFNEKGYRHYRIEAEQAIHYALREEAEFTQPLVYFYTDNELSWAASARAGTADDSGDRVYLTGNVSIEQRDEPDNPLSLVTQDITLHPRTQFAETAQPVTIRQAQFTTQAVGMLVDMTTGTVTLQAKVISRYDPNPSR